MRITSAAAASLLGLLAYTPIGTTDAFAFVPRPVRSGSISGLRMSMKDTYDELSAKVTEKLGLQGTDFTETFKGQTWTSDKGVSGTAEWMSEASPKFLTGVSMCSRVNSDGTNEQLMMNIWMGPSYDVPHMLLTFGEQADGKYAVTADFVVRGATPIGSDPQYLETFYGEDVTVAWTTAYGHEGAEPLHPPNTFAERLLASPARISVGNLEKSDADALVKSHVDRFLAWLDDAQPIAARLRGSFNLRDDKLRQYYYRGEMTKNIAEFDEGLGQTIGAVNTGPTAEAYVGGGS